MTINSISTQSASAITVEPKGKSDDLGQEDFLRLLTEQLKYQDPFDPVENQEMVAQMAQISTVEGVETTNQTLKRIAAQLDHHSQLLDQIRSGSSATGSNATPSTPA